ncbi:biotin-dependent carboxyltransferase [candidate division KSB1 bacterium]|nr:biotin-dependent carboxyltransferase [candidate division KSB1 bacterium]
MPFLQILSPGFLTTIQDAGRFGFAHLGVSPAGAADMLAFRVGNMLVSNAENSSALEMTLVGGTFVFACSSFIALTGADCDATLDEQEVPSWRALPVRSGQTLQCRATKNGARTYLCIHGGIEVTPIMSSAATHLQTGIGGLQGRALKKGDALAIAPLPANSPLLPRRARAEVHGYLHEKNLLRVTLGPQADFFSKETLRKFYSTPYLVTESSNRAGLRLKGEPLARSHNGEMITEGVSLGAVQVTHEGQPIILFVEHPTTGGYPKIANVISADLPRVGQLRPRDEVRFQLVEFEAARDLYLQQQELLTQNNYCQNYRAD